MDDIVTICNYLRNDHPNDVVLRLKMSGAVHRLPRLDGIQRENFTFTSN